MYQRNAFGNPDGSRTDIEDMLNDFIEFDGFFPSLSMHYDQKIRVIVGAKGSGKTVYLRRLNANLKQNESIYLREIEHELPSTDLVVRFSQNFLEREITEKWMYLWKFAILRCLISNILFNKDWAKEISESDKNKLLVYEGVIFPKYKVVSSIYAEARNILSEYTTANSFNKYAILIFGKLGNFKEYNPYSGNYGKLQNCTLIYVKDFSKCIPVSIVYREFENFIKNKTKKLNKRKHCYRISAKTFLRKIFSLQNELDKDSNKIKVITICAIQIKVKMKKTEKLKFSRAELCKYIDYVQNNQLDKSKFVDIAPDDREFTNTDINLIAFYLPQFHSFPANDDWFGKGFSEWTNATKTVPQYIGHYQPHLPYDVGFYNLETEHIFKRQIELAKMYGIKGFSFYYYWFSGNKIMEKPIQMFLKNKSLDMPFCMFWANENWSHLWGNGADEKILYKQEIVNGDAEKFMADILPYMKDERYIKIDNKPLLMIYNPEIYSKEILIAFIDKIRQIAKDNGFSDLYINTIMKPFMKKGEYKNYLNSIHFDGIVEFLPGCMHNLFNKVKKKVLNPLFKGNFLDVKEFVENKKYLYKTDARVFKGIFPMWDNSPRRCYRGATIFESSPQIYKKWLKDIIKWTKINNPKNEQYIFINAWNEWAEGAHLEPDQKYGYAYLQATKEALGEENS